MARAIDVAAHIVNWCNAQPDGTDLTALKLQKLLYYGQGYHLALTGQPLFEDELQAWDNGPVQLGVYGVYLKAYGPGVKVIDEPAGKDIQPLGTDEAEVVDEVLEVMGQFSAVKLRNMSHSEPPWLEVYEEGKKNPISVETMREYFKERVVGG